MDWLRMRESERHETRNDARPAGGRPRQHAEDRELARRAALRGHAFRVLLAGVFVAGAVAALLGKNGYGDLLRLQRESTLLRGGVAVREAAVARLEREVLALEQDPQALERVAREQLGLSKPGEIDFVLPREADEEPVLEMPRELGGP